MKLIEELKRLESGKRESREVERRKLVEEYEKLLRRGVFTPEPGDAERLAEIAQTLGLSTAEIHDDAARVVELVNYEADEAGEDGLVASVEQLTRAAERADADVRKAEAVLAAAKSAAEDARSRLAGASDGLRTLRTVKQLSHRQASEFSRRLAAIVAG